MNKKGLKMNTVSTALQPAARSKKSAGGREASRRKLIDIPEGVFVNLSVKAAAMGMNLKKYIEQLLADDAGDVDEEALYRYLVKTRPEGKVLLNEREQADFELRHGIKRL